MLDGNAVAGLLQEIFGGEMTANTAVCVNCGNAAQIGAMLAFTQTPGVVLRCPAYKEVMLRLVQPPKGVHFEARGTAQFGCRVRESSCAALLRATVRLLP